MKGFGFNDMERNVKQGCCTLNWGLLQRNEVLVIAWILVARMYVYKSYGLSWDRSTEDCAVVTRR